MSEIETPGSLESRASKDQRPMSTAVEGALGGPAIEVVAKATRRRFTLEYKRKIVREADACKPRLASPRSVRASWQLSDRLSPPARDRRDPDDLPRRPLVSNHVKAASASMCHRWRAGYMMMKLSRLGIFTAGSVRAFISSLSPMMPFRCSRYAVTA